MGAQTITLNDDTDLAVGSVLLVTEIDEDGNAFCDLKGQNGDSSIELGENEYDLNGGGDTGPGSGVPHHP